jgi:hypothetical protein
VFGAGLDYVLNAGVQQIHYQSLTIDVLRGATISGPILGTPTLVVD